MSNISKTDKIMITGGHMTPALAIFDELNSQGYSNIVWVGHKHSQTGDTNLSAEYKIITSRNIPFIDLVSGKLFRSWSKEVFRKALKSLVNIPLGFFRAFKIIHCEKPKIVISFGGYLALPIVISAWLQQVPSFTHEQVINPGLSNKIISRFAKKVFVSWNKSKSSFPEKKTIYTGNPIRSAFIQKKLEIESNSSNLNFNWHKFTDNNISTLLLNHYNSRFAEAKAQKLSKIILIIGGNQGSHIINDNISKILPIILNDFTVIHQTGNSSLTQDYEKAVALKASLPESISQYYLPKEFINEFDLAEVMALADLVIGRSGANSCFEYMFLEKYCVLIPIPDTSGNEQAEQADFLQELGIAKVILQTKLTPEILNKAIYDVIDYKKQGLNLKGVSFTDSVSNLKVYAKADASEKMVEEILTNR